MKIRISELKQIFASIADVATVLQFLGFPGLPVFIFVVWVVGAMTGVDIFWVLVLGPISAFAILGAILCGVLLFRKNPKSVDAFDLAQWRGHGSYFVWIAACLWSNQRPWPYIPADSPSYPMLQKLKGAIQTSQLNVLSGQGGMSSRVSHEELVRYAGCIGEQPRFLFPGN